MTDKVGPTGNYPDGKLNEHDEGELSMAVGIEEGVVVIKFGAAVTWLGLSPDAAVDLAKALLARASQLATMRRCDG